MAMPTDSVELDFYFEDPTGEEFAIKFPNANKNADDTDIKAAATAITTNGTVYETVPVTATRAFLVSKSVYEVDTSI